MTTSGQSSRLQPTLTILIFLVLGGLIGSSAYVAFIPPSTMFTLRLFNLVLCLAGWLAVRRFKRYRVYEPFFMSFFAVALGLLASNYFAPFVLRFFSLTPSTVKGIAVAKLGESLPIILSILVFHFVAGGNRDGLFLRIGNLGFGLTTAAVGVGIFLGLAALQVIGSGIKWSTISPAIPWILIFTLSNALLEELWFRALFLQKLENLLGIRSAIVLTSLIFGLVHISSRYVIDILLFVPVTILLGVIWAWVMHRSKGIWSPVLIHAAGDVLAMIGLLAGTS